MLTTAEKKSLLSDIATKIEKQDERRDAYLKELSDDKATLENLDVKLIEVEAFKFYVSNFTESK